MTKRKKLQPEPEPYRPLTNAERQKRWRERQAGRDVAPLAEKPSLIKHMMEHPHSKSLRTMYRIKKRNELWRKLDPILDGTSLNVGPEIDALGIIFEQKPKLARKLIALAKAGKRVSARACIVPTPHEEFMAAMRGTTETERRALLALLRKLRKKSAH